MSKLNTTFGGFGLAVAVIAAVAVTGCDPYTAANESPPEILGVLVADINVNAIQPARCSASADMGCAADFDCPTGETCVYDTLQAPGSSATCDPQPVGVLVTPTGCIYQLPRRAGGIWGPGYPTVGGGGAWTVDQVPVGAGSSGWPGTAGNYVWAFAGTRIIFNKLMDGSTIQTDPVNLTPPPGSNLKIDETVGAVTTTICDPGGTPAVPCQFDVFYDPSSPTPNYGASMVLVPGAGYNGGLLLPDATYHFTVSTVLDHQARSIPIDVTVSTIP